MLNPFKALKGTRVMANQAVAIPQSATEPEMVGCAAALENKDPRFECIALLNVVDAVDPRILRISTRMLVLHFFKFS